MDFDFTGIKRLGQCPKNPCCSQETNSEMSRKNEQSAVCVTAQSIVSDMLLGKNINQGQNNTQDV